MKMTKSQSEQIISMRTNYAKFNTEVNILGVDDKNNIIGELDAPVYTQRFIIGKKGAISWKYKFDKL